MSKVHDQTKLKSAISELMITYVAKNKGISESEFGQVYDSERWENMLNRIVMELDSL